MYDSITTLEGDKYVLMNMALLLLHSLNSEYEQDFIAVPQQGLPVDDAKTREDADVAD